MRRPRASITNRIINRAELGGGRKSAVEAAREHVLWSHIMVRRHDEVRQFGLDRSGFIKRFEFTKNAVGSKLRKKRELHLPSPERPMISQIDDFALSQAINRTVRLIDKIADGGGMPMIPASLFLIAVHALLDDRPLSLGRDEESMQVKFETILHCSAIDLCDEAARTREAVTVYANAITQNSAARLAFCANACLVRRRRRDRARSAERQGRA